MAADTAATVAAPTMADLSITMIRLEGEMTRDASVPEKGFGLNGREGRPGGHIYSLQSWKVVNNAPLSVHFTAIKVAR